MFQGDLGFVLDRHYVDPPLSRVTTIPTLRLPPPINPLDLNYHPVRLANLRPQSASSFLIRLPYPHAPASHPNSSALLVPTHLFASSQFQNERRT
ncbi:hypothetical protein N7516_003724 [Penicillium verrucosum]|uniref:uncharacterized protein n=1 Tax=Penicillium verrucosum TaxID=60171 RepID=UPI002545AF4D|nr:uncharacterized protein N7516_003724 [Penicillium verrucosum]KAJ5943556.1 hypothetical protein N7516_003724 [Penicillium verrucosum]